MTRKLFSSMTGAAGSAAQIAGQAGRAGRYLGQTLRLMVGVPDYQNYVDHTRRTHPEREPMTYEAFFRERQQARYGGKNRVGCC